MRNYKILQITPRMPYPLTDGGAIAVFNITKWHALQGHDITLVTYPLEDKDENGRALKELSKYAKVHLVSNPLPSRASVLMRTMFRGAYPLERRNMPEMYELLAATVQQNKFDLVHVDHAHMGPYGLWLKKQYGLPIILRENNFESQIYERFAATESNPAKSFVARLHGKRLKQAEIQFLNEFDAVAAISEEDAALMKAVAPNSRLTIIPAGADTEYFVPSSQLAEPATILTVGTLAWDPNFDAVRYFLRDIFPLILQKRPDTILDIVGSDEDRIKSYTKPFGTSVRVYGRVTDIRDYLTRATAVVVPLRIGGGMRIKLLEFFAAGKAIIATTIAAEGNPAINGEHLLIRDKEKDFAAAVETVLADSALRKSLGERAREFVVSRYSWAQVCKDFTRLYGQVLERV
jgi:glycosyltransferase involved in cell wall biosynthesis